MGSGSSAPTHKVSGHVLRYQTPQDRRAASLKSIEDPTRFERLKQDRQTKTVEFTVNKIQVKYGEMRCGVCGCDGASDKCCLVPECGHRFHTACLIESISELMKSEIEDRRRPKPVCPRCVFGRPT